MKTKKIQTDEYLVEVVLEDERIKRISMEFTKPISAVDPEEAALIREATSMVNSFLGTQFVTDMMNTMAAATVAEAKFQQAQGLMRGAGALGKRPAPGMQGMKKCPGCQAVVPADLKVCTCGHRWN